MTDGHSAMVPPALPPRKRMSNQTPPSTSYSRHVNPPLPESIPEEKALPSTAESHSFPTVPPHQKRGPSLLINANNSVNNGSGNFTNQEETQDLKTVKNNSNQQDSFDPDASLEEQPWYWGEVRREEVNEVMREKPSGTFLLRNSTTTGDFTLTLRKDNSNKLIKIYGRDGKYGFSLTEPLKFSSIPQLVQHYRHHSLKQYNRNLDIMLLFPLTRASLGDEEENLRHEDPERLGGKLREMHAEYLRKSLLYDSTYEAYTEAAQELQQKQQALVAFNETLKMFQDQLLLFSRFETESYEQRKSEENRALILSRCDNLKEHKRRVEEEIKMRSTAHKRLEREVNSVKPSLLWLYRKRERFQSLLTRKGMSPIAIQQLLKEVALTVEAEQQQRLQLKQEGDNVDIGGGPAGRNANPEDQLDYCLEDRAENGDAEGDNSELFGKWPPDLWLMPNTFTKVMASSVLDKKPTGTFLVRPSSRQGFYALSIACDAIVHHCLIEYKRGVGYGFADTKCLFPSLPEFVAHYACNSLRDHNKIIDTTLRFPVRQTTLQNSMETALSS